MIFTSKSFWERRGITDELHQIFLLQWEELFNERSPDSWQVRTCNTLTLLNEIQESAKNASTFEAARFAVQVLIAELKKNSSGDPIIKRHFPSVSEILRSLPNGEIKLDTIPSIRTQINVLQACLAGYRDLLVSDLKAILANGGSKEELCELTLALGTELSAEEYSLEFLSAGQNVLAMPAHTPFINRFDSLISRFSGRRKTFSCKMCVAFPTYLQTASLNHINVNISVGLPVCELTPLEQKFYKNASLNDVFADVVVEAMDPFDADRIATERLSDVFAVRQLYQVSKTISKKGSFSLVSEMGADTHEIRWNRSQMGNIHQPEDEIARFFDMEQKLDSEDASRLNAAAQYHRLACMASSDDVRLVNLWIALESLTRSNSNSIIEGICNTVAPCVAALKIQRLVRGLKLNLQLLLEPFDVQPAERDSRTKIYDRDVLDALLDPDEGEKAKKLYTIAEWHPLLKQRIFYLRTKMFASSRDLHGSLVHHKENVDWQLRRIYRSRNSIAHQGHGVPTGRFLLQHLHTYFITTAHCLIGDLQSNPGWKIGDALTYRRMIFEQLIRGLERDQNNHVTREQLIDPRKVLGPTKSGEHAWRQRK